MTKTKLLLLSDSPSATSGLGRITRDLVSRIHENLSDTFEVATLGFGGPGSSRFGWQDYHMNLTSDWTVPELPLVWKDFVGEGDGVLMPVWDLSRLGWLADPSQCANPMLRNWLANNKMQKWVYHPTDAAGPNGKLSVKLANTMKGFDRVLDYSKFSCLVTGNTEYLPHGLDTSIFTPQDKSWSKRKFRQLGFQGLKESSVLVGIVATNQARKDYALGIQTCKALVDRGIDLKLWIHSDAMERFWDIPAMIVDHGLQGRVFITNMNFSDEQMATFYGACDVTLAPSSEGFGFPIYESIACGTPVVHHDYAGGAEWLDTLMKVRPIAYRHEGPFFSKRPVGDPEAWAYSAKELIGTECNLPSELDWNNLWPKWSEWLKKGIE